MCNGGSRENSSIEYKSSWRDEWTKWACDFVNARGGTLYVGIDDNGVVGLKDTHRLLEDVPNKLVLTLGIAPPVHLI